MCAMAEIEEFLKSPTEVLLDRYTKDQLLRIVEYYEIEISDKHLKDTVKSILKANLKDKDVLEVGPAEISPPGKVVNAANVSSSVYATTSLTFEQQKEMLILKLKHDEMIKKVEIDQQLMVEKLCFET